MTFFHSASQSTDPRLSSAKGKKSLLKSLLLLLLLLLLFLLLLLEVSSSPTVRNVRDKRLEERLDNNAGGTKAKDDRVIAAINVNNNNNEVDCIFLFLLLVDIYTLLVAAVAFIADCSMSQSAKAVLSSLSRIQDAFFPTNRMRNENYP
jgi:hypothetical protein